MYRSVQKSSAVNPFVFGIAAVAASLLSSRAARSNGVRPAMKPPVKVSTAVGVKPARSTVEFDRDVRPILSENCFPCHGFDENKRQAGLRLDTPQGAYAKLASGFFAVVPGKPKESELTERITSNSPIHMPPDYSAKKLTPGQIKILTQWIAQGAKYQPHWSFVKPVRPPVPAVRDKAWPRNPIDSFVLARLEKEGLRPSPEADRATLIRRLSLDLTGLPPAPEEVAAFVADDSPDAYERLVNRLLDSSHFGERMALKWLDLARYADTNGYHIDNQRDMWRWRDWVIDAYNRNMPYNEFLIDQLAGDLLPHPTLEQRIATGFNRNHPIDFEGGAIPEEYHAAYIFNRIDTTATTFMGLTVKCAQCHDHKFDPIRQKEFYEFYAFFNTISEQGLDGQQGNSVPYIKAPYPGQQAQMDQYNQKIADLDERLKNRETEAKTAEAEWEKKSVEEMAKTPPVNDGLLARYSFDEETGDRVRDALGKSAPGIFVGQPKHAEGEIGGGIEFDGNSHLEFGDTAGFDRTDSFSYGAWIYPKTRDAMAVLSRMDDGADFRGWDLYLSESGQVFAHMIHKWDMNALRVNTKAPIPVNQWTHVFVTYDGSGKAEGIKIYVNGKPADLEITHNSLTDTIKTDKPLRVGSRNPGAPFRGVIDEARIYGRALTSAEVERLAGFDTIRQLLAVPADKRSASQQASLNRYYLDNVDEPYRQMKTERADWRSKADDLDKTIPTTMVMQEMDHPRVTHVLLRGQYDQLGEVVTPNTPSMLPPMAKNLPRNRLGLALWLADPNHPLTSRVEVNRLWEMFFGLGIVKTSEDFGTQGSRPSHPELLDWLATEFTRTGWDVKAMIRMIVNSSTYRQSSRATHEMMERDPEDRLLERAPRFRLPAETIRDQALSISGLLVDKQGGPSVKPYQPAGLWEEISFKGGFTAQYYEQDHGEALYRRSMYTFWKRTVPPPALETFDATSREVCTVRRSITNTPLQALVLMDDPTYVEASRKIAERLMTEVPDSPAERAAFAFRLATCRAPKDEELGTLLSIYNRQWEKFHKDPRAAAELLSVGESPRNEKLDTAELAAWTSVASVILNLDETITRN
jgi:hypothetical protein